MGLKKTLCSLLFAAGIAASPKAASADSGLLSMRADPAKISVYDSSEIKFRPKTPPLDIRDKVRKFFRKDVKEVGKESTEYGISAGWRFADTTYKGFMTEMSNGSRRIWISLGSYFTGSEFQYENKMEQSDLVSIVLKSPLAERVELRKIYLDSQVNCTLYRYTLNPTYKRPFQLEVDLRVGAGLGLSINSYTHTYIQDPSTDHESRLKLPLPDLDIDAAMVFSAGPVVKLGFATGRYIFEVDSKGRISHIVGVGVRF